MKKSLLGIFTALLLAQTSATAQPSAAYQAEEQAFRARQNEGARLHQTYGENSPQYQEWLRREKGGATAVPQQAPANPYPYGYQGYDDRRSGSHKRKKKHHKWSDNQKWSENQNCSANNNWNWNAHDWAEQKAYMRSHWKRNDEQLSAMQRQQLDNEMRAQWLQYHNRNNNNNNWNNNNNNNSWNNNSAWSNPNWNQYSDPGFLDYIHNRQPGLLQQLRTQLGF